MDDGVEATVNKVYDFTIQSLLYYQRLFEYSGDILQLLQLPYNMFQDLILKQIDLRKKEQQAQANAGKQPMGPSPHRPVPPPLRFADHNSKSSTPASNSNTPN